MFAETLKLQMLEALRFNVGDVSRLKISTFRKKLKAACAHCDLIKLRETVVHGEQKRIQVLELLNCSSSKKKGGEADAYCTKTLTAGNYHTHSCWFKYLSKRRG
eukprot:m.156780 g.156780  ORF g.156780 m.156780 type:complete len:104 (-) comp16300_c1_seq2:2618-2929(-)